MKEITIKQVRPEDTWPIRHEVMWPDRPLAYVQLPEDTQGQHYGLLVEQKLVSVVSLFVKGRSGQLRKFATLESEQGKGYGSQLLSWLFKEAKAQGIQRIWCNARVSKLDFYTKFGLQATKNTFSKGGIDYAIVAAPL